MKLTPEFKPRDPLRAAVHQVLVPPRSVLHISAGLVALSLATHAAPAFAAPFPAEFELSRLLPANGGDGSEGVVWNRNGWYDRIASSLSNAGDINGDGIDDLIIGGRYIDFYDGRFTGGAYVIFGRTQGAFPTLPELHPGKGGDGSEGFIIRGIGGDWAGESVSAAGDVNGDGVDDLIIGAPFANTNNRFWTGQSYVVFGRAQADADFPAVLELSKLLAANGGDGSAGFALSGIDEDDISGTEVSSAGDINGDGVDDLVIAAHLADVNGRNWVGESYVVFGRGPSKPAFPAEFQLSSLLPENGGDGHTGFILYGVDEYDRAGDSVTGVEDINGDGVDDLIIGASNAATGNQYLTGETYVVFGRSHASFPAQFQLSSLMPANGGDGSAGFVLRGIKSKDHSGRSVDGAGDLNGDGINDLVIGAYRASPGDSYAGEAYVVFGKDSTTRFPAVFKLSRLLPQNGGDGSEGFILNGLHERDYLGGSVSAAGDVNGDGMDDLLIGADQAYPRGVGRAGQSFVVFGRDPTENFPAVFDVSNLLQANGGDGSTGFALNGIDFQDDSGSSVSAAGDVNGDGIDDILIAADNANYVDYSYAGRGEAYLVFGRMAPAGGPLCEGSTVTILGTSANDDIRGTSGPDVISGLAGNDTIRGLGGDDIICGGQGNDVILGNAGNDTLFGQQGNDTLKGGGGIDLLSGGPDDDVLNGGGANDQLFGDEGNDRLAGGSGNDRLDGGDGTDRCNGGAGTGDTATSCEKKSQVP